MSVDQVTYWKTRCEAAEKALHQARAGIQSTPQRTAVLRLLGDLRGAEALTAREIADTLGLPKHRVVDCLEGMQPYGLVARSEARGGGPGHAVTWKLGYLVQVEEAQC
jgi:DNA-binding MarR family transcriptional regulator